MKRVKMRAISNEEGPFFDILDGGRGVVEALMGTAGLAIFAAILGSSVELADKSAVLGVTHAALALVYNKMNNSAVVETELEAALEAI